MLQVLLPLILIPSMVILMLLIKKFEDRLTDFFKQLFLSRYKIVNKNEGLRPFHLYRKTFPWGWVWQDSYREFQHAQDDIRAIRNRWTRGFRITVTYFLKDGGELQ